jgi:hypothetical protein
MHNLILVFCLERPFTIIVIKPLQDDKYFKYERMWIQPKATKRVGLVQSDLIIISLKINFSLHDISEKLQSFS